MIHFDWDENKNIKNKQKHGVSFDKAKKVFDDMYLLSWLDGELKDHQEERWISLGCVGDLVVIVVVRTFRRQNEKEIIRIISGRKATKKEVEEYFKNRK